MKERRIESKNDWLFACIGGDYYVWMLAIGRFCLSWEKR